MPPYQITLLISYNKKQETRKKIGY